MSETASTTIGIASRYATAVFDLAKEAKKLVALEKDVDTLRSAIADSTEFRELISSPIYSRDEQVAAMAAISKKMGLSEIFANTVGLMAKKGRLFVLPQLVRAVADKIADEKGEITAEVVSAKKLTKAQETKLAAELKSSVGKDVKIQASVDEALIGGLVIKLGSKMIDTSIACKLANLQNAMKEVG